MKVVLILLLYSLLNIGKASDSLLKGQLISSDEYSSLVKYAFDNKFNTQFKSIYDSYGWVGINFRSQQYITKIEWGTNETDENTYLLGIFEGANERNFEDAFPLYMVTTPVVPNVLNTVNIQLMKSIQYFRYIGPSGHYCKINNIKIYANDYSESTKNVFYKPSNLPLFIIHSPSGEEPKNNIISANINIINNVGYCANYPAKFGLKGNEALNK